MRKQVNITNWRHMDEAPHDRWILVRRYNGNYDEFYVVHWTDEDLDYPWIIMMDDNALAKDRPDEWCEIPK